MKKVYLAHPISTTGEFNDSIRVAERINHIYIFDEDSEKNMPKYDVYAPALNKAINDKSNNPTPQMIYEQDVERLLDSDIVVVNYTGGDADGTVLEKGILGGLSEAIAVLSAIKNSFKNDEEGILDIMTSVKYLTGKDMNEREIVDIHHLIVSKVIVKYLKVLPKVFVYSSNQRALKPQLYSLILNKLYESGIDESLEGFIPSGKLNAMVLGLIEKYFTWCKNEDDMIAKLSQL